MTDRIERAIYEMTVRGTEQAVAAGRALDGLAISSEKVTRATRTTASGFERLVASYDPLIKAQQQADREFERLARYAADGIGTAQQHATVLNGIIRKYDEQVAAIERARSAQERLNREQAAARASAAQGAFNQVLGVRDDFGTANRSADIAAYGRALDDLRAKFNPLYAIGRQYKETLTEINHAYRVGAITERERAAAIDRAKTAFAGNVRAMQDAAKAGRLMSGEMLNLTYQLNDVVTGLALGQSPFMILAQQGGQVYQILANSRTGVKGAIKEIGASLAGLITPTRLAVGGLAVLGVAAYAMYESWKKTELALDAVAKQMGVTIMQAHALEAAAAFKGIKTDDFLEGMRGFAQQVYLAKNNMGGLAEMMRANGKTAKDFNGYLEAAADLVKNAASEQARYQILQQMGLPTTHEWVQLLSKGGEGLRRAREEAVKFGNAADEALIAKARKFDKDWNQFWKNFALGAKVAFVEITTWFDALIDKGRKFLISRGVDVAGNLLRAAKREGLAQGDLNSFYTYLPGAAGTDRLSNSTRLTVTNPNRTVDPNALRAQLSLEQQLISLLGNLATVQDQVRSKEIEINLARLAGVGVTKQQAAAILLVTRVQAEGARLTERAQLGLADSASQWKQAENEIQVLLLRRVITLKEVAELQQFYAKKIEETVKQAMVAKAALPDLMRLQMEAGSLRTQLDRFATDTANNIGNAFADIITGAKSAGDAFRDLSKAVIRSLTQMAVNMMIVQPIAASLQQTLGGVFGAPLNLGSAGGVHGNLPAIHHAGGIVGQGTSLRYIHPAYFDDAPRFHSGGLLPDEVPIIAKRGEEVGWPDQLARKYGGSTQVVVNNYSGEQAETRRSRGPDGRELIEVVIGEVKSAMAQGGFDKALSGRFGAKPTVARR